MEDIMQTMLEAVSGWGLKVIGALGVLVLGLWVARIVRATSRRLMIRSGVDGAVANLVGNVIYFGTISLVGIAVLGGFGIETASLITILGASSLAIGLALQGSLSNIASGVMLMIFRPYSIGEFVELGDHHGHVREIGLFATKRDTLDNVRVIIPNRHVSDQAIRNCSVNGYRRVDLELAISSDDNIAHAREIIGSVLDADPRILRDPSPFVGVSGLGDTSTNLVVQPFCRPETYWDVRFDLVHQIKDRLEAEGLHLPCPQREVRVVRSDRAA